MAIAAFGICLIISCYIVFRMSLREFENIDRLYWTVVILIPIIILGYMLKTLVVSEEAAAITFCFIYLDSTILLILMIFIMLRTMKVNVPTWIKATAYLAAILHLFVVWGSIHNDNYFRTITLIPSDNGTITKMESGPFRIYHYIYLVVVFAAIIGIIIAGFVRNGSYSKRAFVIYAVITVMGIGIYAVEWIFDLNYSLLPFLYVISDVLIAMQYDRIYMHDINFIFSNYQQIENRGYAAFDTEGRFLSSNRRIFDFWPALANQRIDEKLDKDSELCGVFYTMMDAYEKRNETSSKYQIGDMRCVCEIMPFTVNKYIERQGYFFDVRDATQEEKTLEIITSYNQSLNALVAEKTQSIKEMQAKIVLGMANMIENRDNNTGGHVKRTSDIIHILVDEIIRQDDISISTEFAKDIVRAAPMHDLGKLTIENSILNKPDKLTNEEYEIMKTHSSKSGEMVMILLDGVEEEHFVTVAYNVARYHHERWDGRGYPEGLVGSMIPIEARIMAVADVYDALCSKRSYKEGMPADKAARIMLDGMGTQFDPALKPIFMGCRGRLEAYYADAALEYALQ